MCRVKCFHYEKDEYKSRQGYASFYIPKMKQKIHHCGVFMKNGKRWISLPTYKDYRSEETKYLPFVEFDSPFQTEFLRLAIDALDDYCSEKFGTNP